MISDSVRLRDLEGFGIVELTAFVEGQAPPAANAAIRACASALADARTWTIAAPRVVEDIEDGIPIRRVVLSLYDARSVRGEALPIEVDAAHLDEATALLLGLASVSEQSGRPRCDVRRLHRRLDPERPTRPGADGNAAGRVA